MAEFKLFSIRQDSTIVAVDVLDAPFPVLKSFGQRTCKHESRLPVFLWRTEWYLDANVFFLSFFVSEVIETGTLQTLVMTSVIIEQGCLFDCWDKCVLPEMYEFNLQSCEAGCRPKAKAMPACIGVQVSLFSSDLESCSLLLFLGVEFERFFLSQYESICSEVMKDTAVLSKVTT